METQLVKTVALTWAQRAQAELGAENRFQLLAEELDHLGANSLVVDLARKASADERRHAKLCSRVAQELGHPTGFAFVEGQPNSFQKDWVGRESETNSLLCEVVLMCCITETINASLLTSIYSAAKESAYTEIIKGILKDEIKHSQIGWAHLGAESRNRDCGFLSQYLPQMLDICVRDELFAPSPESSNSQDSFNFGVMPVSLRLEQFTTTLTNVVLPGFDTFGINTEVAKLWLNRKSMGKIRLT